MTTANSFAPIVKKCELEGVDETKFLFGQLAEKLEIDTIAMLIHCKSEGKLSIVGDKEYLVCNVIYDHAGTNITLGVEREGKEYAAFAHWRRRGPTTSSKVHLAATPVEALALLRNEIISKEEA